ncbi:hypothetical protein CXF86_06880 [Shewanella sp. GutCb]|uniref:hypothetical protein n=1 Tax=Shewanella sp. GutCb TaxID=2058315 RepID=UPI000C7CD7D6|nr:hypothetical protein [Shewanella sp. GutCb]PKG75538.1 hypothetical protein CXF86_06880 [Shewanella sp. GutCb]
MLQYKQEFGEGFDLGFELRDFPFLEDKSWKDEACPSFMLKSGDRYLVLWVDYPNKEERENTITSRYSIVTATNLGSAHEPEIYHDEHSFTLFETEEPESLALYLSNLSIEPFYPV